MKDLVIYHANCVDGFTAAWACWRHLGDDAEYLPAQYGDPPPDVVDRHVLIVDFSYPRDTLLSMWERSKSLGVCDHHKTAQAELIGLSFCVFDMERSGAGLAWDALTSEPRPKLIDYVEDRDLWRWALPHSREISAYIALFDRDFEQWTKLSTMLEKHFDECVERGSVAIRVTDNYVASQRDKAALVHVAGHDVPIINTTFATSELVGELAEGRPFAIGWFERSDGKVVYSLRSRGDGGEDVSKIAKHFGGGGHKNAAGFTMDHPLHRAWPRVEGC